MVYDKIYKKAKKSIIVIDDYISLKTLNQLKHIKSSINITIISDNKGGRDKLQEHEYKDFQSEHSNIKLIQNCNIVHDRYIILDYGFSNSVTYHCGASSKDAGKKVCNISQLQDVAILTSKVTELLRNPELSF